VEYDDLTVVRLEPGRGFLERSSMLSLRVWEHERTLEAAPGGCLVTDRLRFEPRLPGTTGVARATVAFLFRHRHRRLRRRFGGTPA
jgi:ligand-binding SRPBCC domain-containing protein